jgi:hypothetical protein
VLFETEQTSDNDAHYHFLSGMTTALLLFFACVRIKVHHSDDKERELLSTTSENETIMTTHFHLPVDEQTRVVRPLNSRPRRLARSSKYRNSSDQDSWPENSIVQSVHDQTRRSSSITHFDQYTDTDIEEEAIPSHDFSCKGIYLDECRQWKTFPLSHVLRQLENETFIIRYCALKATDVRAMIPALQMNSYITKLDFQGNNLGVQGAIAVADILKENEYIDELNLAENGIESQGKRYSQLSRRVNFVTMFFRCGSVVFGFDQ